MNDREKEVEELTNHIINNITMVEVMSIITEKAREKAIEIVNSNQSQEEYKKEKKDSFWQTVKADDPSDNRTFTTKKTAHRSKGFSTKKSRKNQ